jgi:uncharacterized protein
MILYIDALEEDYLYAAPSQIEGAGLGLYTAIDIFKDEQISLFKGEILDQHEAELRASKGEDGYFVSMLDGTIMDSAHTPCFAKYANDAVGLKYCKFKNNAKITTNESGDVCLVALKKIAKGSEIFTEYGSEYWGKYRGERE